MAHPKITAGITYETKSGHCMTLYSIRNFQAIARKILKADGKGYNESREIVNLILKRYAGGKTYLWGIDHNASFFSFQNYDRNGQVVDGDGNVCPNSLYTLVFQEY